MSEEEKAPYVKMSSDDQKRYENQLAEREKKGYFTMSNKSKSTDPDNAKLFQKSKEKGDASDVKEEEILKPKRAINAYIFFSNVYIEKLRKTNPEKRQTDYINMAGDKWGEMSDSQKQPYFDMNAADQVRQQKQVVDLEKKGYFLLEDGTKSTDPQNVPKKRKTH